MAFTEPEVMVIFCLLHYHFGVEALLERATNGFDTVAETAQKIQHLFSDFPDDHVCILECIDLWGKLCRMAKSEKPMSSLCLAHVRVAGDPELLPENGAVQHTGPDFDGADNAVFSFMRNLQIMTDSVPKLRTLRVELLRSIQILDEVRDAITAFEATSSPFFDNSFAQIVACQHKFKLACRHLQACMQTVHADIRCL